MKIDKTTEQVMMMTKRGMSANLIVVLLDNWGYKTKDGTHADASNVNKRRRTLAAHGYLTPLELARTTLRLSGDQRVVLNKAANRAMKRGDPKIRIHGNHSHPHIERFRDDADYDDRATLPYTTAVVASTPADPPPNNISYHFDDEGPAKKPGEENFSFVPEVTSLEKLKQYKPIELDDFIGTLPTAQQLEIENKASILSMIEHALEPIRTDVKDHQNRLAAIDKKAPRYIDVDNRSTLAMEKVDNLGKRVTALEERADNTLVRLKIYGERIDILKRTTKNNTDAINNDADRLNAHNIRITDLEAQSERRGLDRQNVQLICLTVVVVAIIAGVAALELLS